MSALSASVVIDGEVGTEMARHDSWDGYVIVRVMDGYQSAISLYIAEDKARELVDQLIAALAAQETAA